LDIMTACCAASYGKLQRTTPHTYHLTDAIRMDFHIAAAFHTPPSFPHICLDPDSPPLPDGLLEEAAYTSPTSLLQLSLRAIDCFNIFYRLHRLALAASSHWQGRVARLTLSNLLYETQFLILSVPDYSREFLDFDREVTEEQAEAYTYRKSRADAASILEGLLAATLIFVYAALRALPTNAKLFTILLHRLRIALDRPGTLVIEVWKRENNVNMLVWVLVVGCSVAPLESRTWWVAVLAEVCGEMDITSRVGLEDVLKRVAWIDVFFEGEMAGMWEEVLRLRRLAGAGGSITVSGEGLMGTIDPSLLATQTWDKEVEWGDDGNGYEAPVDFKDGRWKVGNWYV
jgi:hypothetical protein